MQSLVVNSHVGVEGRRFATRPARLFVPCPKKKPSVILFALLNHLKSFLGRPAAVCTSNCRYLPRLILFCLLSLYFLLLCRLRAYFMTSDCEADAFNIVLFIIALLFSVT